MVCFILDSNIQSITLNDDDYTSPDRKHSALVIIDVQRDFTLIGSSTEIPGTFQVVQYIRSLVQAYRELAHPIIHVVRLYRPDGSNVDMCRRKEIENGKQMVMLGNDGAELVDELKPYPSIRLDSDLLLSGNLQQIGPMEWIMYKPRWGAFYNTALEKHLHSLGVNTVVVCGVVVIFLTVPEQPYMKQVKEISELSWLKTLRQSSMI
jgi:nicotinamidase-related amidase